MLSERFSRLRLGFWTSLSVVLIALMTGIAYLRFTRGLGAVTHLSDSFPWGLWIGFDVLCGVGLAAGGFAVTATVHILHLGEFKPIVRPTVLTAFLGYLLVIAGLVFDLGKPWNIWHPIIMWNPHSVMFEVGWCVMLYTTVLSLEFAPMVLERFNLNWMLRLLKPITPILVILGVILSTLHQSSLGSLFLILPEKMHPLWYTPMLPVLFFVSALAAGIAMTVVESWFSRRAFRKPIETHLLSRLSRVSVVVLALYLVLRVRDLIVRDALSTIFPFTLVSVMFLVEIGFGVALPMALLAFERYRQSPRRLAIAQGMVVLGFIFHRLNVSVTAIEAATGRSYLPSIMEFIVSAGLVACGMTIFLLACRYLPVFPEGALAAEEAARQAELARQVNAVVPIPRPVTTFDRT
ncbi:MAG: Ni/Fe-hydrogenase cytochrome b subunit [Acidobacteriia bacterium]|nr:Ni/Fe-hydrogenase cytochrome b subunit [Terriglobia bacterium]